MPVSAWFRQLTIERFRRGIVLYCATLGLIFLWTLEKPDRHRHAGRAHRRRVHLRPVVPGNALDRRALPAAGSCKCLGCCGLWWRSRESCSRCSERKESGTMSPVSWHVKGPAARRLVAFQRRLRGRPPGRKSDSQQVQSRLRRKPCSHPDPMGHHLAGQQTAPRSNRRQENRGGTSTKGESEDASWRYNSRATPDLENCGGPLAIAVFDPSGGRFLSGDDLSSGGESERLWQDGRRHARRRIHAHE